MAVKLTDKDYHNLNRSLKELDEIKKDIQTAKNAGVPNMDNLERECEKHQELCIALKQAYFPNKK